MLAPMFGVSLLEIPHAQAGESEQKSVAFMDYTFGPGVTAQNQTILVPVKTLIAALGGNGMCQLASELCAEDGTKIKPGCEIVRLQTPEQASLWDMSRGSQGLAKALSNHAGSVLVTAALRARLYMPPQGPLTQLLDIIGRLLSAIPADAQPFEFTLLGYTVTREGTDEQIQELWIQAFSLLSMCVSISFRNCECEHPAITLHICRAIRTCLETNSTGWIRLFVFPSVRGMSEPIPELAAELPKLLRSLRSSKLGHRSISGHRGCDIPVACLPKESRYLAGVVRSALDCNRFVSSRESEEKWKAFERGDKVPAFFMHGVLYIWRFLLDYPKIFDPPTGDVDEALDPQVEE